MIHWANLLWIIPVAFLGGFIIAALMTAAGSHRDDEER